MICHRVVGVVMLVATGIAAAAPVAAQGTAEKPTRVVLFSASGGISKGAYQGGVDWAIAEFLRRQRIGLLDSTFNLPYRYQLGAATGASAGNVNALFAALAWCTDALNIPGKGTLKEIPAEDSLFWKAWVNTGFSDLLPEDPRDPLNPNLKRKLEPAAFDREFFMSVHKPSLEAFRDGAVADPSCADVPVGLTLTKLTPIEVALDSGGNGSAAVQRFASVFRVVVRDRKLDFSAISDEEGKFRSLGALALVPALYDPKPGDGWLARRDAVFDVVMASSSFPVAFAPKSISYLPGGLTPRLATGAVTAQFADGGVFDNNPLGLAVGLFELRGKFEETPRPMVAYSNPGNYRGAMALARRRDGVLEERTGLGAAAQLLGGAIESARQYELQVFARQMDRDQRVGRTTPDLRLSSRAFPIVGETMGAFGAFLGRPLRERDFYLGVYDGFEFLARHVLCDRPGLPSTESCVAEQHMRIITEDVFRMSDLARTALSWYMKDEYGAGRPPTGITTAGDFKHHELLLEKTHRLLPARTRKPEEDALCGREGDPIGRLMCKGGLDDLLTAMSQDRQVRAASAALLATCTPAQMKQGECIVDARFNRLLRKPHREVFRLTKRAIENVELAEDEIGKQGLAPFVEAGFSIFRAATYRYRDGPTLFMSSAPTWDHNDHLASAIGYVAPGYVQWTYTPDSEDNLTLGWRPLTYALGEKWALSTTADLSVRDQKLEGQRRRDRWGFGASIGSFAVRGFAAVDAGVYWMPKPLAHNLTSESRREAGETGRWIGRASIRFAADKVQLTVLAKPHVFTFGVGLNDLNGVLFWWKR